MPIPLFILAGAAIAWFLTRENDDLANDEIPAQAGEPENNPADSVLQDVVESVTENIKEGIEEVKKIFNIPERGQQYAQKIAETEAKYGLPESLLARLLHEESRFREDVITGKTKSPVGAVGIAQFMPATAADLKIDPLNPEQAIDGAGRYLAQLKKSTGDWLSALAAYNWGIGNVQKKGLENMPEETRKYTSNILNDVSV